MPPSYGRSKRCESLSRSTTGSPVLLAGGSRLACRQLWPGTTRGTAARGGGNRRNGGRRDHLRTVSPLARRSQRVGGCSTRGIEVRGGIQDRQALEPRGGITPGTWRIRSRRGRDRTHRGGATGEAGG